MRSRFSVVLLSACLAGPGWAAASRVDPAPAQTCPAIAGGSESLAALPADARLDFLRARLARERSRAWDWSTGWKVTYGALIVGQLALVPLLDEREHPDLYVGAATSAIGLASLLVLPLPVLADQPALERRVALEEGQADRCALLAEAEDLVIRDAADAAFGRGWLIHAGNLLIAVGAGLVLWQGMDDWESGLTALVTNFAVGELMIWTQPSGLEDDLVRYRRAELGDAGSQDQLTWGLSPLVVPKGAGLTWTSRF